MPETCQLMSTIAWPVGEATAKSTASPTTAFVGPDMLMVGGMEGVLGAELSPEPEPPHAASNDNDAITNVNSGKWRVILTPWQHVFSLCIT